MIVRTGLFALCCLVVSAARGSMHEPLANDLVVVRSINLSAKRNSPLAGTLVKCQGKLLEENPHGEFYMEKVSNMHLKTWGQSTVVLKYSSCGESTVTVSGQPSAGLAFQIGQEREDGFVLHFDSLERRLELPGQFISDRTSGNVFHCQWKKAGWLRREFFGVPLVCTADPNAPDVSGTIRFSLVNSYR